MDSNLFSKTTVKLFAFSLLGIEEYPEGYLQG
jgi:hypothetical protein